MINDVIDHLAGITPGSRLDRLRDRRPDAREHAQRSYDALFTPDDEGEVTLVERDAVATFVTGLHQDAAVTRFYADRLAELAPGLRKAVEIEVEAGRTEPLARFRAQDPAALGARLTAALEHAHLLVFRPRAASQDALDALARAGWSTTGIVTLSQLVAFLSFQVRVITGLRLLNQEGLSA